MQWNNTKKIVLTNDRIQKHEKLTLCGAKVAEHAE